MIRWIVALDVEGEEIDLADELRGTARKFRPHISLRGRFLAPSSIGNALGALLEDACLPIPPLIELSGPVEIASDLVWLECGPDQRGFVALQAAHRTISEGLAYRDLIAADETPKAFTGPGFRPHLTLDWGPEAATRSALQRTVRAAPSALVAYSYAERPWNGPVMRREFIRLG